MNDEFAAEGLKTILANVLYQSPVECVLRPKAAPTAAAKSSTRKTVGKEM